MILTTHQLSFIASCTLETHEPDGSPWGPLAYITTREEGGKKEKTQVIVKLNYIGFVMKLGHLYNEIILLSLYLSNLILNVQDLW